MYKELVDQNYSEIIEIKNLYLRIKIFTTAIHFNLCGSDRKIYLSLSIERKGT